MKNQKASPAVVSSELVRPLPCPSVASHDLLGEVMLSALGQIFVFDTNGQQVAELQKSLVVLWAEKAEALGYKVDGQTIQAAQREITLHKSPEYGWGFSVT